MREIVFAIAVTALALGACKRTGSDPERSSAWTVEPSDGDRSGGVPEGDEASSADSEAVDAEENGTSAPAPDGDDAADELR